MIDNTFASLRIVQTLKQEQSYSDMFVLCGPLNQNIVNSSIVIIENKLSTLKYSKSMISKAKLVGIEIMENMFKHQLKGAKVKPYFQFTANSDGLTMIACNSVSKKEQETLRQKLDKYESLPLVELKDLYLKRLGNGKITKKGNAGLGILTIYNRSGKNSGYLVEKISENEYYFSIEVKLLNDN